MLIFQLQTIALTFFFISSQLKVKVQFFKTISFPFLIMLIFSKKVEVNDLFIELENIFVNTGTEFF